MKNTMKRIMALALVLAMIIGVVPSVFAVDYVNHFTDVPTNKWYAEYVEYVNDRGWMNGIGNNLFGPDDTLERAMVATVLYRKAGSPAVAAPSTFTDVPTGKWYSNAVAWAQANGVVNGVSATEFAPSQNVLREELVTMIWRGAGSPVVAEDYLKNFPDAGSVRAYAKAAFNWAIANNIIGGSNGKLLPQDNATRAEFAKIMTQYDKLENPCESHKWDDGKVTKEATCTEAGEKTYTCTVCGATKVIAIPALGHVDANKDNICDRCGEKLGDTPTPPTPTTEKVVIYYAAESKVMTTEEYTYTSSSSGKSKVELVGADATLEDGKVKTSATNVAEFEMTTVDGITTFKTADGKYLYVDGTDVKLVDAEGENTKFVLEDAEGGKFIRCATAKVNENAQYIEFYKNYFTVYRMDSTQAGIYTFGLYPLATGGDEPTPPTPSGDKYVAATELKEGDQVILVCDSKNVALCGTYNGFYNNGLEVAPVDGVIENPDSTIVWTVGKEGEFYTFSYDGKKIGMGDSYTSMPLDAVNYKWQVEAAATEGCFYVKNLDRDPEKAYYMQWRDTNSSWSGYHTLDEALMAIRFYVKTADAPHVHTWNDGVVTTEPTCTTEGVKTFTCTGCGETKTEAIAALGHIDENKDGKCDRCGETIGDVPTPSGDKYVLTNELKDGDEVVLYNAGNGKALAAEMSTYYVAGVDTTPVDNTIEGPDAKLVWKVTKNADGTFTFTQDGGKALGTSSRENNGKTYFNLYVEGDHDTTWTVVPANAETSTNYIYSATLTGTYEHVYVEWYANKSAFSAYDTSADRATEKDFGIQFYVKSSEEPQPSKGITVCFTNDVHGAYELYPYAATAMNDADLIVDAGDNIQGSVATTLTNGQCMVDLMKTVGYDVAVPGNHEFDYGFARFLEIVNGDNTPYISANLWDKTTDKPVLDAYKIFTVGDKKVAIVGITTPETLVKSTPAYFQNEKGEYIYDFCNDTTGEKLYNVVQKAVDAAKAEGADYVIAVGHLGIDEQSEPWTSTSVIANTTGIDALIDGHSHSTFSNTAKNKNGKEIPVAQTGTQLANVGKLTIAEDGTITATVLPLYEVKSRVNETTGKEEKYNSYLYEADATVAAKVEEIKAEVAKVSDTVVAKTEVDLTTLDPETGLRAVRSAETNLGDLCADAYRELLKTDVAFVNGGGVRANINKGDITYGQIIAVHPFGNTACKIEVTGEQLWTALEIGSAACPGESGGFLQVSGIEYTINTAIPTPARFNENKEFVKLEGAHRVTDVKVNGEPLDVNKTYTLGGHNYMLINGGDGYTVFKGSKVLAQEVAIDNEVLIKYITGTLNGVVAADSIYANPTGAGRIKIVNETPEQPDQPTEEYVAIYSPSANKVATTEEYTYTGKTTKVELVLADATLADGKITTAATNVAEFKMTEADGTVTFATKDGKYLYADGTNVKLVDEEGENTKFVLEDTENGKFVRCATAQYNGNAQYLEIYGNYLTVYGKKDTADPAAYTFAFYTVSEAAPHVHTWDDGVVTTEPTCTAEGVKTFTCTGCAETKTEPVAALGHNYVDGVCTRCGAAEPTTPPVTSGSYVKVTEDQKDWSGTYLIVYEASNLEAYVFTGVDTAANYVSAEIAKGAIASNTATKACEVTVAKQGDGYSFQLTGGENSGKYLTAYSGRNKIVFSDTAKALTISVVDGVVKVFDGTAPFQFNKENNENGLWFRFFGKKPGGQSEIALYKLAD